MPRPHVPLVLWSFENHTGALYAACLAYAMKRGLGPAGAVRLFAAFTLKGVHRG